MQSAMYLMMRDKHEKHYNVKIDYYLIFYFAVDTGEYKQFKISLSNGYDGDIIVETLDGKPIEPDIAYQLIAGKTLAPWSDLNTDNVMARYDEPTVKKKLDKNDLSKTKYNEWLKNPMAEIGDWQCSYCDFKSHCYPVSVFTLDVEDGVLTLDEAMRELGYDN